MDGANSVFQGQQGTGDAFVYKGMDEKSLALVDKIFNISGKSPRKSSSATSGTKDFKKPELKRDFHYKWASEMAPKLNNLENIGVQFATKGIDVVNDPSAGEAYVLFNKSMAELQDDKNMQDQLGKIYDETSATLSKSDKKYDPETIKKFDSYYNRPWDAIKTDIKEGKLPPRIEEDTTFDFKGYLNEFDDFKMSKTTDAKEENGFLKVTTTEQLKRSPLDAKVAYDYTQDPVKKESFDLLYENIPQGSKEFYEKKASKAGKPAAMLFAQDFVYDVKNGYSETEAYQNIPNDRYYKSKQGIQEIEDRAVNEINPILKGVKQIDANGKPTSKEGTLALRKLNGMFQGRELQGMTVSNVIVKNGIVYAEGTARDPFTKQLKEEAIEIFNLNADENRSAQAINAFMNNNGWKKIDNDYIVQYYDKKPVETFSIKPTNKKQKANPSTTKKKSDNTQIQLSITEED